MNDIELPIGSGADYTNVLATIREVQLERRTGRNIPAPRTLTVDEWRAQGGPDYDQVLQWRSVQLARFEDDPDLIRQAKIYYRTRPVEFINHWCDTYDPRNAGTEKLTKLPLILFERQAELIEFLMACLEGEAPALIEKARDMGATWVCIALTVWLWLFWPGVAIGWGSNKQEKVDKIGVPGSIFEKIRMLIWGLPKVFLPEGLTGDRHLFYMRCINPVNGATITGEIGTEIGRGDRTRIYFVDEAAHLDYPEKVEAALSETTRVRVDISSVSGLGTVFHRTRESGIDWVPGAKVIRNKTNVFVMDYSAHPMKTEEWHTERKQHFEERGLAHVFARETDRDYAASVEGVVIPAEWARAAIDAHITLGFDDEDGAWVGGLDVADEGLDKNAFAARKFVILRRVEQWTARDTAVTARKAVGFCKDYLPINLQYDCIGLGSGVKGEINRLEDDDKLPEGFSVTPWNAGAAVLHPIVRSVPKDRESPMNKDLYANLKAQAWWMLRQRFEKTWKAIKDGEEYDPDELISLDSKLPLLQALLKELSQPTMSLNTRMKLTIDKAPEGTRSPNLGDAVVMCYFPVPRDRGPIGAFAGPRVVRSS